MPTLPNFLVIGAAKCGTTTLCELLAQHPEVFVHPRKELDFFCFDDRYARGLDWYAAKFEKAGACVAVGEGSPNYAKHALHPHAAERIARDLPGVRLIYMVRHPMRRMESAWLHARRSGHRSSRSFTRTVRAQPSYVDTSDYARQLDVYLRHFDRERILVIFLEDLKADPQATLARVFRFLGVDDAFRPPDPERARNVSAGQRVDGWLLGALRRVPGFRRFDRKAPRAWRRFRKRVLQGELARGPEWDEVTRRFVIERIGASTARFLVEHGKPADFWDLTR